MPQCKSNEPEKSKTRQPSAFLGSQSSTQVEQEALLQGLLRQSLIAQICVLLHSN